MPNLTLFRSRNWHLCQQQDPFNGYSPADVLDSKIGLTTNDSYGKIYCYIKALFRRFYRRARSLKCNIKLYNLDVADLAQILQKREIRFARIEVSSIPLGPVQPPFLVLTSIRR